MKKLSFVILCFLFPVSFSETLWSLGQNTNISLHAQADKITLTPHDVAIVLKDAGFPKKVIPVMTCLAEQESHFKANAINVNSNHTRDHGLFQVNDVWLDKCQVTPRELKNPRLNAKCALQIFHTQGFEAWSSYKHSKSHCLSYRVPTINYIAKT